MFMATVNSFTFDTYNMSGPHSPNNLFKYCNLRSKFRNSNRYFKFL